jgi:cysteine desulfurase
MIYLDNNATTKIDPAVRAAMDPYLGGSGTSLGGYGNPNSLHAFGMELRPAIKRALDEVYAAIGASEDDDVLATGCATESNNTVIKGAWFCAAFPDAVGAEARAAIPAHKRRIITSAVEHPCVHNACEFVAKCGARVVYLPPGPDGRISPESLRDALDAEPGATSLVSIMWANNETGIVNPIAELCAVAHAGGALFHTDAVQAIGKVPVDVRAAGVDYLTLSAHKFHGPKGVGALYVRCGAPIVPLLHGGEQMGGMRSGTLNVAGIIGMGAAISLACGPRMDESVARIRALRDRLEDALLAISGVAVVGDRSVRTPNTILASFRGVEGEAFLWDLNRAGIAASTGSACASESLEANPVLQAMSFSEDLSHTGIRFSLSRFTTDADVDAAIVASAAAVDRLRKISGEK